MSIEKVAVIGAGQMGRGIAQVLSTAGKDVTIVDINDAIIANSEAALDKGFTKMISVADHRGAGRRSEEPHALRGRHRVRRIWTTPIWSSRPPLERDGPQEGASSSSWIEALPRPSCILAVRRLLHLHHRDRRPALKHTGHRHALLQSRCRP